MPQPLLRNRILLMVMSNQQVLFSSLKAVMVRDLKLGSGHNDYSDKDGCAD